MTINYQTVSLFDVSVNSNWVHPPGGISSKNLPGESGFDFWQLPGGPEFDKDREFEENESEDQIFTGENKKTSWIFYFYRGLRVFSMEFFLVYGSIF